MSSGFRDVFLTWGFIYAKFIYSKALNGVTVLLLREEDLIHCTLKWNYMDEQVSNVYLFEITHSTN